MSIDGGDYRLSSLSLAIDTAGIRPTRFDSVTVQGGCFRTSCTILDRYTGHRGRISVNLRHSTYTLMLINRILERY